uniref:Uncharacterized protein n=1 Tax=Oryza glumipatula TaxID=40148 RepID=A0A0E0AW16_9ORYZ
MLFHLPPRSQEPLPSDFPPIETSVDRRGIPHYRWAIGNRRYSNILMRPRCLTPLTREEAHEIIREDAQPDSLNLPTFSNA